MNQLKIFAIVVTYNGEDTIDECLRSLTDDATIQRVIVIDNGSQDSTLSILSNFPEIKLHRLGSNIGFGQANNIGIMEALSEEADFVFLLNQDAVIFEDTIPKLLAVADEHKEYGILSPMHINGSQDQIDPKVSDYLTRNNAYLSDLYFSKEKECYEVEFINAAAWLISDDCLKTVGGFDDIFFMYGEDDDYCHRARKANFKIGVVPMSMAIHYRSGRRPQTTLRKRILQKADYETSLSLARIKKSKKKFLLTIILWLIDHVSAMLKLLFNGHFSDLLVSLIAGLKVIIRLPKLFNHIKKSRMAGAFLTNPERATK